MGLTRITISEGGPAGQGMGALRAYMLNMRSREGSRYFIYI